MEHLGIICAFVALLAWGVGDFMIQKSVRKNSVMRTLFYICFGGGVVLFPFIKDELWMGLYNGEMHILLAATGLIIFVAAVLEFEGMRRGKISIIEPILSFELPVAVILSVFLRNEALSVWQIFPIITAFIGLVIASQFNKNIFDWKKLKIEQGIFWAIGGAVLMGVVNFLVGVSSQETSALLTIWYTNIVIAIICALHFFIVGEWKKMADDFKDHPYEIVMTCLFDNCAWIAYAYATTFIPISIATTISESYIILPIVLGVLINRERVRKHQMAGIAMTVLCVFVLSLSVG